MNHKMIILLCAVLVLAGGVLGNKAVVKASGVYTGTNLTITKVDDIDVYNDYIPNLLLIDNTIYNNQEGYQIYKFTLEQDGFVSLLLATSDNLTKVIEKGASTTIGVATLTATVYRDAMLLYPVVPTVTAKDGSKGESKQKIALDQGTYYVAVKSDKYRTGLNPVVITTVRGDAVLMVYYQKVNSSEVYRPSSVGKENPLTFDIVYPGLLTATNPKDYYTFELTDKALVKINFMYNSTKSAKFVLYGVDREELVTQTLAGNNVWYNIEKYLEPGKYYCSLQTVTLNDGGQTNLLVSQNVYPLVLTQENSSVNSYITVETIDQPMEIRYVKGKLTNSELASSKWKNGKVITDILQFGVNMTGYYTVRVTDEYGNMFMQSIRVNTCDKKAPNIPTIKVYVAGTFVVSGTAEKNSIVTVTVNGKAYQCIASSKGSYKCTVKSKLVLEDRIEVIAQDISGNVSEKEETNVK